MEEISREKVLWVAADKLIGAVMPHDDMKSVLGFNNQSARGDEERQQSQAKNVKS